MRVICTNKELIGRDIIDHYLIKIAHITINKIYDAVNINEKANPFINRPTEADVIDIFITDDAGRKTWYPYYLFEPIQNIRNEKIEQLLV